MTAFSAKSQPPDVILIQGGGPAKSDHLLRLQPLLAHLRAWINVKADAIIKHGQGEAVAHHHVPSFAARPPQLQRLPGRHNRDIRHRDTIF